MLKYFGLCVLVYAALVLETSCAPHMAIGTAAPAFAALAMLTVALSFEGWAAIAAAAIVGLLADCLSDHRLGVGMLAAAVLAYFLQRLRGEQMPSSAFLFAGWGFLTVFGFSLAEMIVESVSAGIVPTPSSLFIQSAGTASYSALIAFCMMVFWNALRSLLPAGRPGANEGITNRWKMLTD